MNTNLLRLARLDSRGIRYWIVPGFGNGVRLTPALHTGPGWGPSLHWPHRDAKGECIRGVDLDRHWRLARREIRELLASCSDHTQGE